MGFIWTFELIPAVFQIESQELYAISGVLNCLDGVFLFLIFGLNKIRFNKCKAYNLFKRRKIDMTLESSLYSVSTKTSINTTTRSSPSAIVTTLQ